MLGTDVLDDRETFYGDPLAAVKIHSFMKRTASEQQHSALSVHTVSVKTCGSSDRSRRKGKIEELFSTFFQVPSLVITFEEPSTGGLILPRMARGLSGPRKSRHHDPCHEHNGSDLRSLFAYGLLI